MLQNHVMCGYTMISTNQVVINEAFANVYVRIFLYITTNVYMRIFLYITTNESSDNFVESWHKNYLIICQMFVDKKSIVEKVRKLAKSFGKLSRLRLFRIFPHKWNLSSIY